MKKKLGSLSTVAVPRLVVPLVDSGRIDHRGDEENAPIIHPGRNGEPVRLIVGKDTEEVRHAVGVWLDLMDDSETPPSRK